MTLEERKELLAAAVVTAHVTVLRLRDELREAELSEREIAGRLDELRTIKWTPPAQPTEEKPE